MLVICQVPRVRAFKYTERDVDAMMTLDDLSEYTTQLQETAASKSSKAAPKNTATAAGRRRRPKSEEELDDDEVPGRKPAAGGKRAARVNKRKTAEEFDSFDSEEEKKPIKRRRGPVPAVAQAATKELVSEPQFKMVFEGEAAGPVDAVLSCYVCKGLGGSLLPCDGTLQLINSVILRYYIEYLLD
jgi:hypothetical protein